MKLGVHAGVVVAAICLAGSAYAADWYQWRGPTRNGIVPESPPLVDSFPESGPRQLWKSEHIPGADNGGWGSVVVAAGKVYVYCNWEYQAPITTRTLARGQLEQLGWHPEMPEELLKKVEAARVSEERAKLERKELNPWIKEWLGNNVPEEHKKFRQTCQRRLTFGKDAVPMEIVAKLVTIKDKEFTDEAALDRWFQEQDIPGQWIAPIKKVIPTTVPAGYDQVYCIDAATGMTIWKVVLPGGGAGYADSSTPCVVNGRCYVNGSVGNVYCFDANTGYDVWKTRSKAKGSVLSSSFVVMDGVAILLTEPLTGFHAVTGEVLWTQPKVNGAHASAAYWHKDGKTYLVCNAGHKAHCFDPQTGELLWSVPGGVDSTPAIVSDHMAIYTNNKKLGLLAYKLSLGEPQQLWQADFLDRGASPLIHEGYVYAVGGSAFGGGKTFCLELETGELMWEDKSPKSAEYGSQIVADGKILFIEQSWLYMIEATPEKFTLLGKANLGTCPVTSPALVDGILYLRMKDGVAAYDLRK